VLALVHSMGGTTPPIYLVACEPHKLGGEDGLMGLSPCVEAAIEPAIGAVERLVNRLQDKPGSGR
jgi:hydrogenase maturation protease